jgi:hypothetical protein
MAKSPLLWLAIALVAILLMATVGPAEKSLGTNVRVVYLHGAWVWAALACFVMAGVAGIAGLLSHSLAFHLWSRAFGRTGVFFWITYLPISMWAMQTSWNGLFLAEPRWRLAVVFATGGLLMQIGLAFLENPAWASAANVAYVVILLLAISKTPNVMHPASPIRDSGVVSIQLYFAGLFVLTLLAAWQVARWWRQREQPVVKNNAS